jgi:hypothetical protein
MARQHHPLAHHRERSLLSKVKQASFRIFEESSSIYVPEATFVLIRDTEVFLFFEIFVKISRKMEGK